MNTEFALEQSLDGIIDVALQNADINALRLALYQATGDESLLEMGVGRRSVWGRSWQITALAPDDEEVVREKCRAYLRRRQAASSDVAAPADDQYRRMIKAFAGEDVPDSVVRWGKEELAFGDQSRLVNWRKSMAAETLSSFHAIIIGAGMSGIAMALQFKNLGLPFTIIERQGDVGGTWSLNTYPGARVDVASHHYEFSFRGNHPWKHYFAVQQDLLQYLKQCCDDYGLMEHVKLRTEITSATWNAAETKWDIVLAGVGDGTREEIKANVVISAAGVFHTPNLPDIEGIDRFKGDIFHTARWNHDVPLEGKRIGLIGNGSTGVQLMPHLARTASRLTVFQRTASWMMPIEGYLSEVPEQLQWLFDNMPFYRNWYRFGAFFAGVDDVRGLQEYDPAWQKAGGRISERHDIMSETWAAFLKEKLADRPDLLEKSLPTHLPWAKRPIVESGWYDCLKQPNVELVTDPIAKITPAGIETNDGREHELDIIVLSAGFKPTQYLWPVDYVGEDGVTLEKAWAKDGARAHLGITMPQFPNFFMMYGPNGQPRTIGVFAWSELWARYIAYCVREMLERGASTIECRNDRFETYNAEMDKRMESLIWAHPGQTNYYVNEFGRVGVNMPWSSVEYFEMIERPDWDEYNFT